MNYLTIPSFIIVITVLSACGVSRAAARLPMSKDWVVTLPIGDGCSGRLLVDTGNNVTVLDSRAAERWGLQRTGDEPRKFTDSVGSVGVSAGNVRVTGLRLGAIEVKPFNAPTLVLPRAMGAIDGVIGTDLLLACTWIFDAPNNALHVLSNANIKEYANDYCSEGSWSPLITTLENGMFSARVRCADSTVASLMVDTGASRTSLPRDIIEELRLPRADDLIRQENQLRTRMREQELKKSGLPGVAMGLDSNGGVRGVTGARGIAYPFLIDTLHVGKVEVGSLIVESSLEHNTGLLGADVLGQFAWIIDGPSECVHVRVASKTTAARR